MFDSKAIPYKAAMHLHQCNKNRGEVSKSGGRRGLKRFPEEEMLS